MYKRPVLMKNHIQVFQKEVGVFEKAQKANIQHDAKGHPAFASSRGSRCFRSVFSPGNSPVQKNQYGQHCRVPGIGNPIEQERRCDQKPVGSSFPSSSLFSCREIVAKKRQRQKEYYEIE